MTAIVGPNNGGKTSILESLAFLQARGTVPSLTESHRNGGTGGKFVIEYTWENGKTSRLASPDRGGEVKWRTDDIPRREGQLLVIPSRRQLEPSFAQSDSSRGVYGTSAAQMFQRNQGRVSIAGRLFAIQETRDPFDNIVRRVFGRDLGWYIAKNSQGSSFLSFSGAGASHPGDGLGDGIVTVLFMADALYDSKPGDIVAFDEPELSLHPAYQRRLADVLADYAMDRQIIFATHSTYFISWADIFGGARLSRVWSDTRGSQIATLSESTIDRVRRLAGNRANPHVLGLDAREVFFLDDRIVLVEGQDDVVLYPEVAAQLGVVINGHFYGWGVGGADNMPMIAAVLRDLGFTRVAGILDCGKEQLATELQKSFPDYRFWCADAADVRTKPARAATSAVIGLLDEARMIRTDLRTSTTRMLTELNSYLTSRTA